MSIASDRLTFLSIPLIRNGWRRADDLRRGRARQRVVARRAHRDGRQRERHQPHAVVGLEPVDEPPRRFHRAAGAEGFEAGLIDGEVDEAAPRSARRGRLIRAEAGLGGLLRCRCRRARLVARRELDELGRDHAARLPVDRDVELIRPHAGDRVAVLVDNRHVDRDEVDAGPEDGLLRGLSGLWSRGRLRSQPGAGCDTERQREAGNRGHRQRSPAVHGQAPAGSTLRGFFLRGRAREASTLKLASSPMTRSGCVGSLRRLKKRPSRVRT